VRRARVRALRRNVASDEALPCVVVIRGMLFTFSARAGCSLHGENGTSGKVAADIEVILIQLQAACSGRKIPRPTRKDILI